MFPSFSIHPSNFLGKVAVEHKTSPRTKPIPLSEHKTMDASSYLKKHGWQGSGHSLDTTGRGLKKPLLVSKKVDVLGVGLNKHAAVSDQWWLRAYDQGLATLGTGKESALAQAQKHGVNRGGLYGRFVKGEGMPGTVGEEVKKVEVNGMLPTPQDSDAQEEKAERKRKRADKAEEKKSKRKADAGGKEDSAEKAAKKAKKEAKKAAKGKTSGTSTADASGAEEELDAEKRALYTKRAAEKGVSLEVYIKRRQEKYSAKKDEKRK
jgi:nucleolar protein TMA23